jgi:endoglucanase Acf2
MRSVVPSSAAARRCATALGAGALVLACMVGAEPRAATTPPGAVGLGLGAYYTEAQEALGPDERPPVAEYRSGQALGQAAPTNQWYSSVMFERWSHPIHAHPMTYRAGPDGFELGLPTKRLIVEDGGAKREMRYAHEPAVVIAPLGFKPSDARLARFSDWLAEISLAAGAGDSLTATVLHGSPFSYYDCTRGDVRFRLAATPRVRADPRDPARDPRVAAFAVDGHDYAIFAPSGARWDWSRPSELVLHLPAGARYFSVAGLPDASAATLRDFLARAYAFPTDTRVAWAYDERTGTVRTTFTVRTVAREGRNLTTFMGLYPHQWSSARPAQPSRYRFESVRGPIRLIAANRFAIERRYHGFVPFWPALEADADRAAVDRLLAGDVAYARERFARQGGGSYWVGKGLGSVAQLLAIAEVEGRAVERDALLGELRQRMQAWFDGRHPTYFVQDRRLGTFVGLPQEYHSYQCMNDHHFHYGYWITAAAHVALRDPAWAATGAWGGMLGKLVADVATPSRGRADFPFLRNFDPYEGHSWASGIADRDAGNNQESSSEAVNAWAALILLGEATGDRALRDLGVYLYTSEIASAQQYWFDLDHQVLAAEFGELFASLVFGGAYAYNTWWTEEPRQILGINALPLTPASTYLGADPAFVRRTVAALPAKQQAYAARPVRDGTPADIWQDVLASYLALADADAGLAFWNRSGAVESGETRSHTLYWLLSLRAMGRPDFSVTADTTLYAVFKGARDVRTYLAYNARDTARRVTFSTGKVLDVPPHSLARSR